jgi:hypothetical protein
MLSFTALTSFADPEVTFQYCISTRKRRDRIRSLGGSSQPRASLDGSHFAIWASSQDSQLLIVRGSLDTKHDAKDLSTSVVEHLIATKTPILWVMKGRTTPTSDANNFTEMLKHLTWQALRWAMTSGLTISESFNAPRLQAIRSDSEWFDVLRTILLNLNTVYIVIDAEALQTNRNQSSTDSLELLSNLQTFIKYCKPTTIKLMISSYRRGSMAQPVDDASTTVVALRKSRRGGSQLSMQRASKKQANSLSLFREALQQRNSAADTAL